MLLRCGYDDPMDERLSYAHAGDHARLEHEAEQVRYRGAVGLPKDPVAREELRKEWANSDAERRSHLRAHLGTYHATTFQDIADYGHEPLADAVGMSMLRRLHEELHSGLIDTDNTDRD